ncbi:MAG: glycosyltransferase family 9 protein [Acidobacteriota bacterium]|nr:glycosyltransferase family 9 protein [Acidobacteriota bacterium]
MDRNVLERLPMGARVAIIRLRSLGDCVLTTPAIALLKQFRPDLRLGVVLEQRFAAVFSRNPDIEDIMSPEVGELVRWRPELALNLHGGTRSVQLTLSSRAPLRAGFEHFRFQSLYNIRIPRAQDILGVDRKVHTAEHLASAMFYLGVPAADIPRARLFAEPPPHARPYAVIHPEASALDKTWPAEKFLDLARHIQTRLDLSPVFIAGSGESLAAFSGYRTIAGAPLEEVKSLLAGAALFVGNDSGPAHMAAAFGVPVVVLFGSSDPGIWSPWKTESVVLACPHGIAGIDTSQAIAAVSALLPQAVR